MQPESCTYLYDIQQAAQRVARYVAGKGFADYAADDMLRSAAERQLAIIGEALNQALKPAAAAAVAGPVGGMANPL